MRKINPEPALKATPPKATVVKPVAIKDTPASADVASDKAAINPLLANYHRQVIEYAKIATANADVLDRGWYSREREQCIVANVWARVYLSYFEIERPYPGINADKAKELEDACSRFIDAMPHTKNCNPNDDIGAYNIAEAVFDIEVEIVDGIEDKMFEEIGTGMTEYKKCIVRRLNAASIVEPVISQATGMMLSYYNCIRLMRSLPTPEVYRTCYRIKTMIETDFDKGRYIDSDLKYNRVDVCSRDAILETFKEFQDAIGI